MYIYDIHLLDNKISNIINTFLIDNVNSVLINFEKMDNIHNIHYKYYKIFSIKMYKEIFQLYNKKSYEFENSINDLSDCIPPFKLLISDIINPESKNYGIHRYGWKNVIYNFLESTYNESDKFHYNNPSFEWISYALKYGLNTYNEAKEHYILHKNKCNNKFKYIFFDPWLEQNNYHKIDFEKFKIISFVHDPPIYDDKYKITSNRIINNKINNEFLLSDKFLKIKDNIKILITLTKIHNDYLTINNKLHNNTIIKNTLHPLEVTSTDKFNVKDYLNNRERKIYFIGWWLRKYDIFYKLKNKRHTKIILVKNTEGYWVTEYVYYELRKIMINEEYAIKSTSPKSLTEDELDILKNAKINISNFISNSEYDLIFKNNIVFLDFYSTSANNALLECICNHTPVLIKKNPACVEYLGEEYPFYFESLEEAEHKLNNTGLIIATHNYLKQMPKTQFTYNYFNQQIKNIIFDNI